MFDNKPSYGGVQGKPINTNDVQRPSVGLLFSERIDRMQKEIEMREAEIKRLLSILDERDREIDAARDIATGDITIPVEASRIR